MFFISNSIVRVAIFSFYTNYSGFCQVCHQEMVYIINNNFQNCNQLSFDAYKGYLCLIVSEITFLISSFCVQIINFAIAVTVVTPAKVPSKTLFIVVSGEEIQNVALLIILH